MISGIAIAFFILKHRKYAADYNEVRTGSSQNIIEIPSSTDHNEMRPNSHYYFSQP